MTTLKPPEITRLLSAWSDGSADAGDELLTLLYPELKSLARRYLRQERPDHTLQATALVNEAFLRLMDQDLVDWKNRAHFLGICATLMRRILVDHARHRLAAKRGGGQPVLRLDEAVGLGDDRRPDLVAVDDALNGLARTDPELARLVELRFFGGLSHKEIAAVLGVSVSSVERRWRVAKAWLYDSLMGAEPPPGEAGAG
jgi:RNA polymerase sigma factor (TIGR02999 family)